MKKAQDIMWKNVVIGDPGMTIAAAAQLMIKEDVGCLVVIDKAKVSGIITDRDLLVCAAQKHNIQECTISAHMSHPVVSVPSEISLIKLAQVMASQKIKRVPIVDGTTLVGIVSFSDIADDMDQQVADMWAEWLELVAVTRTSAQHRRGRRSGQTRSR